MAKTPFIRLSLIYLAIFLATLIFYFKAPEHLVSRSLLFITPFFYLVSILSHLIFLRLEKKQKVNKGLFYLKASGVKLGIYIAILLTYGLLFRDDVVPFFISFLFFYVLFSFLEIKLHLRKM